MNAELLALADKRAALSADLEKVQTELDQADLRIKELESRLAAQSPEPVACIRLRPYEIQSGLDRVRWAEGLIRQLPDNHDGRNAWLANYAGDKHDADKIRFTAQADYEARIMAAIEIAPQSDRQPLPGQKQISETGKELPENAEQPMNNADVSVGELAGFFATEFPHLLTMSTQIEVARALLARYRIVRLDRLESGRRG